MSEAESRIPERESHKVEFKSASVLDDLPVIGRAVVAFLNADGGQVWIGVADEEGVAGTLESIPEADSQARRLTDYLLDAIDPSPNHEEVRVRPHLVADRHLVRVDVSAPGESRRPFSLTRRGWRLFVTRVDARNRPMSWDEIKAPGRHDGTDEAEPDAVRDSLLELRDDIVKDAVDRFWIGLRPARPMQLRLDHYEELLVDPSLSENRPAGAVFVGGMTSPEVGREHRRTDWVKLQSDGTLEFRAPLDVLFWWGQIVQTPPAREEPTGGDVKAVLHPLVLVELSVSAFRLARAVYLRATEREEATARETTIVADTVLLGLRGCYLGAGSPSGIRHLFRGKKYEEGDDLMWDRPLEFSWRELTGRPDGCAYRLVIRRTYEAFGLRERDIPPEFDQQRGEFTLAPRRAGRGEA